MVTILAIAMRMDDKMAMMVMILMMDVNLTRPVGRCIKDVCILTLL